MPLESDFKEYMVAHHQIIVAYNRLTADRIKSAAPKLRKALQASIVLGKEMRKSAQAFKDSL
jgi:hypothetical protein